MENELDESLQQAFAHSKRALAKKIPENGRVWQANVALCYFWEAIKSGRIASDCRNYLSSWERLKLSKEDWTNLDQNEEFLNGVLSITTHIRGTHESFLALCAAACRILEEKLCSNDIDWLPNEIGLTGEAVVSLKLPNGSPFKSSSQQYGHFEVVRKNPQWPLFDRRIDQLLLPHHVIQKHIIIPRYFNQTEIKVQHPKTSRQAIGAFRQGEGLVLHAAAHVFEKTRSWPTDENGKLLPFVGSDGIDAEKYRDSVLAYLRDGLDLGTNVFVFPELMASAEAFELLREKLEEIQRENSETKLILAGSAHIVCNLEQNPVKRNQALLLYSDGSVALRQNKFRPFISAVGDFREEIVAGRQISLLATPLGLLMIQICKDFCDAQPVEGSDVSKLLDIGIILVCSMGGVTTCNAHDRKLVSDKGIRPPMVVLAQQNEPPEHSDSPFTGSYLALRGSDGNSIIEREKRGGLPITALRGSIFS